MSTLPLHAPHAQQVWAVPGFARLKAVLSFIADVYGEAQSSMREANKKYPYAGI